MPKNTKDWLTLASGDAEAPDVLGNQFLKPHSVGGEKYRAPEQAQKRQMFDGIFENTEASASGNSLFQEIGVKQNIGKNTSVSAKGSIFNNNVVGGGLGFTSMF